MSEKHKTEGGQGGRKGHSNMVHYEGTLEVKERSKKLRRRQDKEIIYRFLNGKAD